MCHYMNEAPTSAANQFDVLAALPKPKVTQIWSSKLGKFETRARRRFTFADRNTVIQKFKDSHGTPYVQFATGQVCRSSALQISDTVTVGGIKIRRGRPVFGGFSKKFRRVLRRAMARAA